MTKLVKESLNESNGITIGDLLNNFDSVKDQVSNELNDYFDMDSGEIDLYSRDEDGTIYRYDGQKETRKGPREIILWISLFDDGQFELEFEDERGNTHEISDEYSLNDTIDILCVF